MFLAQTFAARTKQDYLQIAIKNLDKFENEEDRNYAREIIDRLKKMDEDEVVDAFKPFDKMLDEEEAKSAP